MEVGSFLIGLGIFALFVFVAFLKQFLVNVGAEEITVMEKRFIGGTLDGERVLASGNQVGLRAEYLEPGLHFVPWPFVRVVSKPKFLQIAADELGIVEATDGASPRSYFCGRSCQ